MKTQRLYAAVLGAGMLAATTVFAGPWDGHPEMQSSILNDLDRPAYAGTGLSASAERVQIYSDAVFPNHEIDQTGYATGSAGPEKGYVALYGSILFDVGALR